MKAKISVIGYFGYRTNKLDGQTVKTRDLTRLIAEHYGEPAIYDTQEFRYNQLSLLAMFARIAKAKQLVYLPAYGNLKYLFPVIWIVAKLCRTRIYYFVVGGWLAQFIETLPLHRFMLRHIAGIYPETHKLEKDLREKYGFRHVRVFPNFRFCESLTFSSCHETGKLKLVFMARVTKLKGLPAIFSLGDYLLANHLQSHVSIDFYGQIPADEETYVNDNLRKYSFMAYRGVLQPADIHKALSQYDALILPTQYPGEGIPGSIVDAYMAGLPVVVTEWKYAHELVKDGETGLIVPYENGQNELNQAVVRLLQNDALLLRMGKAAKKYAESLYSDAAAGKLLFRLLSDGEA